MKCHYELLGVGRDADDTEIKKAYRKLALKLHPDKNPDNVEECTKQFHLVQQAYEVLIDPQERAWYDRHREAILRGGLGHGDGYEDDGLDVYQYFNTACYTGFGDDDEGFYAVYKTVFETLASQDYEFMSDRDSDWDMPGFGDSQSDYKEVVGPFYAFWESFCTARSYVWVEKYDTREAPNRQVRRLMEQDNKKARDKARKERNEEIRALVAFVRKRDKRVMANKKRLEERAQEVQRLAQERREAEKRQRLKNMEGYTESGWSAMSELSGDLEHLEAQLAQQFGEAQSDEADEEEEDDPYEDLFCVACNKLFKTDKAMRNHERSKKHRENVALLRAQMEAEEEKDDDGEDDDREDPDGTENKDTGKEEMGEDPDDSLPEDEDSLELESEEVQPKAKLSKKQKKRRKQQQKIAEQLEEVTEDVSSLGVDDAAAGKDEEAESASLNVEEEEEEPESSATAVKTERGEKDTSNEKPKPPDTDPQKETPEAAAINSPEVPTNHIDTDADSRLMENVAEAENKNAAEAENKKSKKTGNKSSLESQGVSGSCNTCGQKFKSRTKLFEHLKTSGHALKLDKAAATQTANSSTDIGGKRRKNKKGKR